LQRRDEKIPDQSKQGERPPMSILARPSRFGFEERFEPQSNRFTLTGCDHFGLPARDPERSGKFFEQILGGVEFFRAGYSEAELAAKKSRHIFYHVGAVLVELVEQRTENGYPDVTNPNGENMNPHFAFGTTAAGVLAFKEHLTREGIPFAGPRRHGNVVSAASVYFRDIDGNILEVVTWEDMPASEIVPVPPGERLADWNALKHNWRPH
jgi:catechol 2,3-dioxygenase-like lactoylglutathione lyase family enzyme